MSRLLVIVPDRISDILIKGEYQPRYYNPGEVFDEVHILTTTDDRPSLAALQRTVGRAKLVVHNHPEDLTLANRRLGWLRDFRLRQWAKRGVDLVKDICPELIRCHGADWNAYLASRIKIELGIPYLVSLHINPDINPVRRIAKPRLTAVEQRHNAFYEHMERIGLCNADLVMPVYRPIVPYLKRLGVERVEVCYNALNGSHLRIKADYALRSPARIIYIGRLFQDKNPDNIMRALARLPGTIFTIVGDGPIRPQLEQLAMDLGIAERVIFRPAVANDELCELLAEQDVFAVHTEYWEISKSVLEALLTGLPVVINRRIGEPVPELEGDFVRMVENTEDAYFQALDHLLTDHEARSALGRRALAHARANWDPTITESKYASTYRSFLKRSS